MNERTLPSDSDLINIPEDAALILTPPAVNGSTGAISPGASSPASIALSKAPSAGDPILHAQRLAHAVGNHIQAAEDYARNFGRVAENGEREHALTQLAHLEQEAKAHRKEVRRANRRFHRAEPTVPDPQVRAAVPWWGWVALGSSVLGWLGALLLEQAGAALVLFHIGAFDIHSPSEAYLLTATALAVGFALKLAHGALPRVVRESSFLLACLAMVVMAIFWIKDFSREASKALAQTPSSEASVAATDAGNDSSEPPPGADRETDPEGEASTTRGLFVSLFSLMCLTSFVGQVGISRFMGRYETHIPNPLRARFLGEKNFHAGEVGGLVVQCAALKQKLAQFTHRENAAVDRACAAYLAQRATLNSTPS